MTVSGQLNHGRPETATKDRHSAISAAGQRPETQLTRPAIRAVLGEEQDKDQQQQQPDTPTGGRIRGAINLRRDQLGGGMAESASQLRDQPTLTRAC